MKENMKQVIEELIGNDCILLEDMVEIYNKVAKSSIMEGDIFSLRVVNDDISVNVAVDFNKNNIKMKEEEKEMFSEFFDEIRQVALNYPNKEMMLTLLENNLLGNEFFDEFESSKKKLKALIGLNNTYYNPEAFYLKSFEKNIEKIKHCLLSDTSENNLEKYTGDLKNIEALVSDEMEVILLRRLGDSMKGYKEIVNNINATNTEIGELSKLISKRNKASKENQSNEQEKSSIVGEIKNLSVEEDKLVLLYEFRRMLDLEKRILTEKIKIIIKDSTSDFVLNNFSNKFYEELWGNIHQLGEFSRKNSKEKGLDLLFKCWVVHSFEKSQIENSNMNNLMNSLIGSINNSVNGRDNEGWLNKKLHKAYPDLIGFGIKQDSMVYQLIDKKVNDRVNVILKEREQKEKEDKLPRATLSGPKRIVF